MKSGLAVSLQSDKAGLNVDFTLPADGVTVLFGPSGAGKTRCLRAIAGFDRLDGARIVFDGEVWQDGRRFLPPERRRIGYVQQGESLFTHLSVRDNLAYGWRRSGRRQGSIEAMAEQLGIDPLLERSVDRLSGGERQRVAIGRALLSAPRLLLFDEPLAALDAASRAALLPLIADIRRQSGIPLLQVTHSIDEMVRLADRLLLIDAGRSHAGGELFEVMAKLDLADRFADEFGVVIETTVAAHEQDDHLTLLEFAGGRIYVPRRPAAIGQRLRCRIAARDVSLSLQPASDSSILNIWAATIVAMADMANPAQVAVKLDVGGTPLLARITQRSWRRLALAVGQPVFAQVKGVALLV